jgi:hypothetical protein
METLVINIPDKKSALVKELLKELGVTIKTYQADDSIVTSTPNGLTIKTIKNARNGVGLNKPIENINDFIKSL